MRFLPHHRNRRAGRNCLAPALLCAAACLAATAATSFAQQLPPPRAQQPYQGGRYQQPNQTGRYQQPYQQPSQAGPYRLPLYAVRQTQGIQEASPLPPPAGELPPRAEELPMPPEAKSGSTKWRFLTPQILAPLENVVQGTLLGNRTSAQNDAATQTERVPVIGMQEADEVQVSKRNGLVTLVARDAELGIVLSLLAQQTGLNIVAGDSVKQRVSFSLTDVTVEQALTSILSIVGCAWTQSDNIVHVTKLDETTVLPPNAQGRQLRVFQLDYASAEEVQQAIRGLLSPVGQVFVNLMASDDNRKTRETVVVEDLPMYVNRVAEYVDQVDQPPRQVMIDVKILQVELHDDNRHGVNLDQMMRLGGSGLQIQSTGLANPGASQALMVHLTGGNLQGVVEMLKQTTDAKTLASPRVMALNGQEARMQIGEQLGFRVTTTTETSTLESVDFLDVGVVLTVTPRITDDNRILMHIKPEVSSGLVNPETGLPEEETTELETNVLVGNSEGIVIGGLIQEKKANSQGKVPFFGDAFVVGSLFQKRSNQKSRTEIIIALLPRIVEPSPPCCPPSDPALERAMTSIFQGPLNCRKRSGEPILRDTFDNPRIVRLPYVQGDGNGSSAGRERRGRNDPNAQTSDGLEGGPEVLPPSIIREVPSPLKAPALGVREAAWHESRENAMDDESANPPRRIVNWPWKKSSQR